MQSENYYCTECHGRFPAAGDCPNCPGEPLLDISNPEVAARLASMDESTGQRRFVKMVGISVVGTLPITVPLFFVLGIIGIFVGAAVVYGGAVALNKMFPGKRNF